ncbi:hypothetical protein GCM10009716_25860 [Streptomyces sodiiphilus]|uniref:Uncharacterized protein n=1 Tax=Streptomyces sodiiphilus TaxID=226217 RepID=A0ABN2P8G8_9ACTN
MSFGQGGPAWGPGGSQTPDWDALAAEAEAGRRRKRWMIVGGAALAAAAIGTVVALAIVQQGNGGGAEATDEPSASLPDDKSAPSDTPQPEPSFEETSLPPLPKPREFVTDADKDIAPFEAETFYAGDTMTVDGRTYTRTAASGTDNCAEAAAGSLASVLTEHGCGTLLRATYVADGVVVTVGVAQFAGEEDARAAKEAAAPHLAPLIAGETPQFCGRGGCRTTSNYVGRYAYFTIAGNADGSPDSGEESRALQAARDGNDHAFHRIIQRGETQASASASALVEERRRNG